MKFTKLVCAVCSVSFVGSIGGVASPPQVLLTSQQASPLQSDQDLLDALSAIGAPLSAITAYHSSGEIGSGLTAAFTKYANNSTESSYDNLTESEGNALILFGFVLSSDGKISDAPMKTLMAAEKTRAGMSSSQIKDLEELSKKIQKDPSFSLSDKQVEFVQSILPYIEKHPFAFADVLGPLISAFIVDDDNPDKDDVNEDIQEALTAAAQAVSNLSENDIQTITNVTNEYNTTNEYNSSTENVSAINQALAVGSLVYGTYLLYPLIGSNDVYAVDDITRNYSAEFNTAYVDRYNGQVARNRNVDQARRANNPNARAHAENNARQGSVRQPDNARNGNARAQGPQSNGNRNRSLDRSRGGGAYGNGGGARNADRSNRGGGYGGGGDRAGGGDRGGGHGGGRGGGGGGRR